MASTALHRLQMHTERLSRLCALIEAFPEPTRRKELIMALWSADFLSSGCAELLIEHYALEHA